MNQLSTLKTLAREFFTIVLYACPMLFCTLLLRHGF